MPSWEIGLHDKTTGKKLTIKTDGSAVTEDREYVLPDTGGRLLTEEHLADPANFPTEFLTEIKGATGVGITSIGWLSTTDVSNQPGVAGAVDTYKILFSDTTFTTFSVRNGQTSAAIDGMVNAAVAAIVGSAPASLNTLQELAAAINNNSDFYNSIIQAIAVKANSTDVYTKAQSDATTETLKLIPQVLKNVAYTLVLTDSGKNVGTSADVTIPLAASVNFTAGTVIHISNHSAAEISLIPTSGVTLRSAGSDAIGAVKIPAYGVSEIHKVTTDTWFHMLKTGNREFVSVTAPVSTVGVNGDTYYVYGS